MSDALTYRQEGGEEPGKPRLSVPLGLHRAMFMVMRWDRSHGWGFAQQELQAGQDLAQ